MKARIFVPFNSCMHIPPFPFKNFSIYWKLPFFTFLNFLFFCFSIALIKVKYLFKCNCKSTYWEKSKKSKKVLKRQKHSGSKVQWKTLNYPASMDIESHSLKIKVAEKWRETHHINIHDLIIVLICPPCMKQVMQYFWYRPF